MKSAIFALIFSPLALTFLGSAMADIQAQTAVGLPLSSVEGMISLGLATIILALVSVNCEDSPSGMFVTAGISLFIGVAQLTGYMGIPLLQASALDAGDMSAAVGWSVYPLAVTLITASSAIALLIARNPKVWHPQLKKTPIWTKRHLWVSAAAVPATLGAIALIIFAAPANTSLVPAQGLAALPAPSAKAMTAATCAALLLGIVALLTPFSLTGTQAAIWIFMILPAYMIWPLWSTLSGKLVTPTPSMFTSVSLSAPVIATLGLLLGASTFGVYWARRRGEESALRDLRLSEE